MAKIGVVVPAAGWGARMGAAGKKQYLELAGMPVLGHALKVLADCPVVDSLVLVSPPGEEDFCRYAIAERFRIQKLAAIVPGGSERQESVYNGLLALSEDTEIAVIHDGARPLLQQAELAAVVDAAREYGAATLAAPVYDAVKLADEEGFVVRTQSRENLWFAQTPQAFKYALIMQAHREALRTSFHGVDDASLVEALGEPVRIVAGSCANLKITTQDDLTLAAVLLKGALLQD